MMQPDDNPAGTVGQELSFHQMQPEEASVAWTDVAPTASSRPTPISGSGAGIAGCKQTAGLSESDLIGQFIFEQFPDIVELESDNPVRVAADLFPASLLRRNWKRSQFSGHARHG